jgi:glycosyltransferase involved in cell wall biosynthesis
MHTSFVQHLSKKVDLVDNAEVSIDMLIPNMANGWWQGQRKIVFTMWETNVLPATYHEYIPMFDQVLVPCEHNRELFAQYHDNVAVVPLGVDEKFWKPVEREPNERFRFLAGGSHWKRKGLDAVVEAWTQLNPAGAELVIKGTPDTIGGIPELDHKSIFVYKEWMSMEEERGLYRSADCFIAASRGEGWGLMPLQAMCAGIPVLMTDTSGHRVFSHLATRIIETVEEPATYDKFYCDGLWDSPIVESLQNEISWVLDNRDKAKEKGLAASIFARQFSWTKATDKLLKTIQPTTGTVSMDVWQPANTARVEVTAARKVEADIGNFHIRMAKGETQTVFPGVRDVLQDAGMIL